MMAPLISPKRFDSPFEYGAQFASLEAATV